MIKSGQTLKIVNEDFLTFLALSIAAFGAGWAMAVLIGADVLEAIAVGMVTFCVYVLHKAKKK